VTAAARVSRQPDERRRGAAGHLRELLAARELMVNLTLRDLRTRYRRSALGWLWSLVTPLATILIFTVVFRYFLRIQVPVGNPSGVSAFALFLVSGLVAWNYIANSVNGSMNVLIANSNLIKRVWFPREVLVAASVASATITLAIELAVLLAVLLLVGKPLLLLPLLPVLLVVVLLQAVFVLGLALTLSVLNVYFRDLEYVVSILLQLAFYAVPVIYPVTFVPQTVRLIGLDVPVATIYHLNPAVRFVQAFRDLLYDHRLPAPTTLLALLLSAAVSLLVGVVLFRRLEPRLAEEL
jgi:ABC-type polysaccharide/polyol phosphate export permease